MQNKYT